MSVSSCPRVLQVSFCYAVSPEFSLVLDLRGRLGGKVESSCEEFEDKPEDGILC